MASVNKVIIVGNLGRDPEPRYNPEGGAITNISVATTDTWKDKASGEKQERTEWHRVVFFSRLAESAGEYLKKGSTTEIVADRMQMLGSRQGAGDAGAREAKEPATAGEGKSAKKPAGKFDDMEDDIPF